MNTNEASVATGTRWHVAVSLSSIRTASRRGARSSATIIINERGEAIAVEDNGSARMAKEREYLVIHDDWLPLRPYKRSVSDFL